MITLDSAATENSLVVKTYKAKKMSSKKYSPLHSESGGRVGIASAPQGGITVKTAVVILIAAAVFVTVLAIAAFALGIAGLQLKSQTSTPAGAPQQQQQGQQSTAPTKPTVVGFFSKQECGDGQWKRIAYFDMSDPAQECPRGWRGYTSPVRCCGRPVTDRSSCPAVFFETYGYQYSKVCGRATGYQQGSPDGFASIVNAEPSTETVNGIYVDGVSVTHGNPRRHIWTFAVGVHEKGSGNNHNNCPCDGGASPPPFVGNNYFCETGDDTPNVQLHRFYDDDPLWDGYDCYNTTCCLLNGPPYFTVQVDSPTTDAIEVRICGDQRTGDEDSPIALLELYVQ